MNENCIQKVNEPSQNGRSSDEAAASWFGSSAKTRITLERFTRPWPIFTLLLAAFPLFLILAVFCYAALASVYLGHWPTYGNPDPKQLGWWVQHSALQLGFAASSFTPVLTVCLAIFSRRRSRDFPIWIVIITATASAALLVCWGRFDPGGVVAWFWD